jgi:hypothetical protein
MHVGNDPVDGERIPVSAARISPAASTSSSRGAASRLTPPPSARRLPSTGQAPAAGGRLVIAIDGKTGERGIKRCCAMLL